MKHVTILALEQTISSTVAGPMDIFSQTGVLWNLIEGRAPEPKFEVEVATLDGNPVQCMNGLVLRPDRSIRDVGRTDLIIVSAESLEEVERAHSSVTPWLSRHWGAGACLASVCTGAFLLAETGLLDGKRATTHWGFAELFRQRFPKVELRPECLVTAEGRLFCAGGAYSYIDLSLYLVERFAGYEEASRCARSLLLDTRRTSQLDYALFEFQKNHGDQEILKAQTWIENHFGESITVEDLAVHSAMSLRNFKRRFKKATGDTPLGYVQRFRIETAKRALERTNLSIEEVGSRSGYGDTGFFRSVFRKFTGMTPGDYRRRIS